MMFKNVSFWAYKLENYGQVSAYHSFCHCSKASGKSKCRRLAFRKDSFLHWGYFTLRQLLAISFRIKEMHLLRRRRCVYNTRLCEEKLTWYDLVLYLSAVRIRRHRAPTSTSHIIPVKNRPPITPVCLQRLWRGIHRKQLCAFLHKAETTLQKPLILYWSRLNLNQKGRYIVNCHSLSMGPLSLSYVCLIFPIFTLFFRFPCGDQFLVTRLHSREVPARGLVQLWCEAPGRSQHYCHIIIAVRNESFPAHNCNAARLQ